MSKIDQQQLNILYCERKKPVVVKDELETTSRHTLQEYEGSSWREIGGAFKSKLLKIYDDYWFTIIQLGKNVAKRNFAVQHNGNCIEPISQFGRTLAVCWVRNDSFIKATQHCTAVTVYDSVRKAVRNIEVRCLILLRNTFKNSSLLKMFWSFKLHWNRYNVLICFVLIQLKLRQIRGPHHIIVRDCSLYCFRQTLYEKCSEFFWSAFSPIWTEYGEILRNSPYSVEMRENADQKNSE